MKLLILASLATFVAGPVIAQVCAPRDVTYYSNGALIDSPTVFNTCHAFQHHEGISARTLANLHAGDGCSVEASPDGRSVLEAFDVLTVDYGVADGQEYAKDNLTSMGIADSNDAPVLRIRSTSAQDVTLERVGGGVVFSGPVGAGNTLIRSTEGPGTYRLTTPNRVVVKATGPQSFNDTATETRIVHVDSGDDAGSGC